jgi:putative hydrolase of the HAD superfamily
VPLRAVLFDAHGTLIELREPVGESYARLAAAHGVRLPAWRVGDAFARILRQAEPMVFPDLPPDDVAAAERAWWRRVVRGTFRAADSTARFDDFDACFEAIYAHFSDPAVWRAREGAAEALAALRGGGLATAVVSNFDRRLPGLLRALGLGALLDAVVLPSDAGAAKPARRIFEVALERLGVTPAEAAYVGDDAEHDIAGARAAGLRPVDVATLATLAELPARLARAPEPPGPSKGAA